MDALIEQITREVLASLGAPKAAAAPVSGRALVIFDGSAEELHCFLRDGGVAPAGAILALARDSRVRRSEAEEMGFGRVVYMDEGQKPMDLVSESDRVVVPVYRYQQLADLAGLCDSCWQVRLVLKALLEKRPVRLLTGALDAASPFRQKVDGYLAEIAGYGIEVGGENRGHLPIPEHGRGGSERSRPESGAVPDFLRPPPAGTVLQPERSAHPHPGGASPCQLKAVGECGGIGQCPRHLPERVGVIVSHGAERVSTGPGVGAVDNGLARAIDHTLLKPDATREQVLELCEEARTYSFASVCINPGFVALAADALRGSSVKVCTVVGFPLGATTTVAKAMETRDAVANGADEIDMVINVGALKARNDDLVRRDVEAVVEAAAGRIVKVILETALLTDEEKVRACVLSRAAGADFVKTSTGFGPGGATAHDVALMRQTVGKYMGVKASGGIRDLAVAQEMIQAGATRIGASASVKIVKGEAAAPAAAGAGGAKQAY